MERLARTFEADIGEIAHSVAQAAEEVETSSGAMRAAADVTGERAETVAAATHQASSNVQTVAAASQEMAASIQDIARKTQLVEDVSRKAITTASHSGGLMRGLDEAAREISDVVKLIEDIAGRTNLLALNATIEAARAGEAGKGFAVVASEVKALANQTAQATSRISTQVQTMQGAAASAVGAMSEIGKVIEEAAEVMGTITVAVEQQNVMTREIVRNVTEAAAGTDLVSRSITEVSRHARQTSGGAGEVQEVARRLGSQSIAISRKVTDFVGDLRAAS